MGCLWLTQCVARQRATLCARSLFPFPAEPYTAALRAGKRTAHHLILYYIARVDSTRAVRLSPEECDAAVWVPLDQLPALLDADHHGHYDPDPDLAKRGAGKSASAKGTRETAAVALPDEYPRALCARPGRPCDAQECAW